MILNFDKSIAAVVHQFHRCSEFVDIFDRRTQLCLHACRTSSDIMEIQLQSFFCLFEKWGFLVENKCFLEAFAHKVAEKSDYWAYHHLDIHVISSCDIKQTT
jgi:hypothetical protein